MSAHTEGRVSVVDAMSGRALTTGTGWIASRISDTDARRLAACWNACEGLSTDDIEAVMVNTGPVLANKLAECDVLRAELNYYKTALCLPVPMGLVRLPGGGSVPEISPKRVSDLVEEREQLQAEGDQLRAELAEACARNNELIAELADLKTHLSTVRTITDERNELKARLGNSADWNVREAELNAARALLTEVVIEANDGGIDPMSQAAMDLMPRISALLFTPDDLAPPMGADAEVGAAAFHAIALAHLHGQVLTITQRPRLPLAMGNYETVVSVRPARGRAA